MGEREKKLAKNSVLLRTLSILALGGDLKTVIYLKAQWYVWCSIHDKNRIIKLTQERGDPPVDLPLMFASVPTLFLLVFFFFFAALLNSKLTMNYNNIQIAQLLLHTYT